MFLLKNYLNLGSKTKTSMNYLASDTSQKNATLCRGMGGKTAYRFFFQLALPPAV